jgi:lipopolysaccharide biosynthesis glycosyltransferase
MSVVEIAFGADEVFAMPLAVALASIARFVTQPTRAWVVHASIPAHVRARVERGLRDTTTTIEWIDGNDIPRLGELPLNRHFSKATYFRLALPDVLPPDVHRIVYLDSDIVAVDDIAPLFDVDLGGHSTAGVRDIGFPWAVMSKGLSHWRELGLDRTVPYFNSGVLVMDIDRWRDEAIGPRIMDYLVRNGSPYFADQDAINVVLAREIAELAPRWNQHPSIRQQAGLCHVVFEPEEVDAARDRPAVIHYLTRDKPWNHGCTHPEIDRWFEALELTAWAGWRPEGPGLRDRASGRLRSAARTLVKG